MGQRYQISCGEEKSELLLHAIGDGCCVLLEDDIRERCHFAFLGDALYLDHGRGTLCV
jgi:hypothetical protein